MTIDPVALGLVAGPRVMIADDDPIILGILSQVLGGAGFEVETVSDTHAALCQAVSQPFDLLIFDRHMPPVSGDRAIRAIRSGATPNRSAPILLMTAEVEFVSEGDVSRGEPSLYLPKPLDLAGLMSQIKTLGVHVTAEARCA